MSPKKREKNILFFVIFWRLPLLIHNSWKTFVGILSVFPLLYRQKLFCNIFILLVWPIEKSSSIHQQQWHFHHTIQNIKSSLPKPTKSRRKYVLSLNIVQFSQSETYKLSSFKFIFITLKLNLNSNSLRQSYKAPALYLLYCL